MMVVCNRKCAIKREKLSKKGLFVPHFSAPTHHPANPLFVIFTLLLPPSGPYRFHPSFLVC